MNKDAVALARWMIGLAALCVVAIVVLALADKHEPETYTIFGAGLSAIVGAVAGVIVGQKIGDKPSPPVAIDHPQPGPAEVPLPAALAMPDPGPTGPDTGARLGLYEALSADLADADGDGAPDYETVRRALG